MHNDFPLPGSDMNAALKALSENKFRSLWPTAHFRVRQELDSDAGVDFSIELIEGSYITNFRFNIQLKATHKPTRGKDGNLRFSIAISNLNYLMNAGIPAYYFIYSELEDKFYLASAKELQSVIGKEIQVQTQIQSKSISIWREFQNSDLMKIKAEIQDFFEFRHHFEQQLRRIQADQVGNKRITIDGNYNISNDEDVIEFLSQNGKRLINEGNWTEVLAIFRKGSGELPITTKVNAILATANYYAGQYYDCLSFCHKVELKKAELSKPEREHFEYLHCNLQFQLGMIAKEEFSSILKRLEESEFFGGYAKIFSAKDNYVKNLKLKNPKAFLVFENELIGVANNSNYNLIKLTALTELSFRRGLEISNQFVRDRAKINWDQERVLDQFTLRYKEKWNQWEKDLANLQAEINHTGNETLMKSNSLNSLQVKYRAMIFFKYFGSYDAYFFSKEAYANQIGLFIAEVNECESFFRKIGFWENVIVCLSMKYSLLHFSGAIEEADQILMALENETRERRNPEFIRKLSFIKEEGPEHIQFEKLIAETKSKSQSSHEFAWEKLVAKMKEMDELEMIESRGADSYGRLFIELIPIKVFSFPKEEIKEVFNILKVPKSEQGAFLGIWDVGEIPIANILYPEVSREGIREGMRADTGIKCWENVFRVRKAFFDRKFYRYFSQE